MQQFGKKILASLFLVLWAASTRAYEIKGFIQLEESWERRIFLSAIRSFNDMNTASEEFVIASAPVQADGSFIIQGNQLPTEYSLYRLHVVKEGDPVATLIIGGQEENHFHFVMNNDSRLSFTSQSFLFGGAKFENSPINQNFNLLNLQIESLQRAPAIPSKVNWDYQEKQMQEYLLQYADTSQNELTAMYAVYHLNIEQNFRRYSHFLRYFLKKWKQSNSSPYFLQLEQQVEFLRYQQSFRRFPLWIIIPLLLLCMLVYFFWKKRKKNASIDPFLKKQDQLTVQEQKVFQLLTKGKANKEISNELNIEVSTVKSHLNKIYAKLGVKSRKEIYNKGNKNR